jgi:hypothetical protein
MYMEVVRVRVQDSLVQYIVRVQHTPLAAHAKVAISSNVIYNRDQHRS